MINITAEQIQEEVINVIKEISVKVGVEAIVDSDFKPGDLIKSQVLLSAISMIESSLEIIIPAECYIFSDKNQNQLSINQTVQKILKVAKNEK